MCEFCTKHGEGKKWYLNAKNYSDDFMSDMRRRKFVKNFNRWVYNGFKIYYPLVRTLPLDMPIIRVPLKAILKHIFVSKHWGQVVPIEDIEKILAMTSSIVRLPCICRKTIAGKEIRMGFAISLKPQTRGIADLFDTSFFKGPEVSEFENINKDDALNFMKEQEKQGIIHTIWTFGTPFIGGICNCNKVDCVPMKMCSTTTKLNFFRAEYIAEVDINKCTGCRACTKICPFGAIKYNFKNKKIAIDYEKCYGCGICRSVCKQDAVKLLNRKESSVTANLWY